MSLHPPETIAVIFCAMRTGADDTGYQTAAAQMSDLVEKQPGFLDQDHARSDDGLGITISYWEDDASAKAWRDNADHAAIREQGRGKWYDHYTLHVARVERSYQWHKHDTGTD